MEKKITVLQYIALVLSLGIVAGCALANHQLSKYLATGDSNELAQLEAAVGTRHGAASTALQDSEPAQGEVPHFIRNDRRNDGRSRKHGQIMAPRLVESVTPRLPNLVHIVARHADGTVYSDQTVHNLRTNAGINWQYGQMAGTTAAVCTYLALSNDSGTPAVTDTAVASEITTNGLARVNATAAHTANTASYTMSNTFTATGTQSAQKAGLLNASSAGTLCFENIFSAVAMNSGDTLQVVWTVNF